MNISAVYDLRDVRQDNYWLSMNELVQDMVLQCLVVVLDTVGLADTERVVTVGQDHRHNLVFIVQEVARMNMSDGNAIL